YNAGGSCLYSTGNRTYGQTLPVYWGILREAHAHPNDLIIRSDLEIGGDEVLRFARAVTGNSEECSGYFVATMTAEHFAKALSGTYSGQDGICILNGFLETVYRRRHSIGGDGRRCSEKPFFTGGTSDGDLEQQQYLRLKVRGYRALQRSDPSPCFYK
ncbi:MAG: hypothetical protein ACLVBJ_09130, partial [Pilosibacter sp.]